MAAGRSLTKREFFKKLGVVGAAGVAAALAATLLKKTLLSQGAFI